MNKYEKWLHARKGLLPRREPSSTVSPPNIISYRYGGTILTNPSPEERRIWHTVDVRWDGVWEGVSE